MESVVLIDSIGSKFGFLNITACVVMVTLWNDRIQSFVDGVITLPVVIVPDGVLMDVLLICVIEFLPSNALFVDALLEHLKLGVG